MKYEALIGDEKLKQNTNTLQADLINIKIGIFPEKYSITMFTWILIWLKTPFPKWTQQYKRPFFQLFLLVKTT